MNGVKDGKRLTRHICIIAERTRHVKGGCRGSRSFYLLHDCEFLLLRQSVGKEYFKLRMNLSPIPASAGPFSCNVYLSQVELFEQAVIVREYRPVFRNLRAVTDLMNNTLLYFGFGVHGGYCLGETRKAVDTGN